DLLLPFQFLDNLVQLVEACVPEQAVPLDPRHLTLQPARPQLAGPHATDLLRAHETGLLQDADVLLHARQGHVELLGKVRDRRVCTSELLQNAASGGIRERGERGIEAGLRILNHLVKFVTRERAACNRRPIAHYFFDRFCSNVGQLAPGSRASVQNKGPMATTSANCPRTPDAARTCPDVVPRVTLRSPGGRGSPDSRSTVQYRLQSS